MLLLLCDLYHRGDTNFDQDKENIKHIKVQKAEIFQPLKRYKRYRFIQLIVQSKISDKKKTLLAEEL